MHNCAGNVIGHYRSILLIVNFFRFLFELYTGIRLLLYENIFEVSSFTNINKIICWHWSWLLFHCIFFLYCPRQTLSCILIHLFIIGENYQKNLNAVISCSRLQHKPPSHIITLNIFSYQKSIMAEEKSFHVINE